MVGNLMTQPEFTPAALEREKQALQWETAVRDIAPELSKGMEFRLSSREKRARIVSRTMDAEKSMPHLFKGMAQLESVRGSTSSPCRLTQPLKTLNPNGHEP